jgi:hypothetical protein
VFPYLKGLLKTDKTRLNAVGPADRIDHGFLRF